MTPIHRAVAAGTIAVGLLAPAPRAALGQTPQTQAPPPAQTTPLDTAALGALNRMGEYLNTLEVFQITGDVRTEKVLEDGQKIERSSKVELIADRPRVPREVRPPPRPRSACAPAPERLPRALHGGVTPTDRPSPCTPAPERAGPRPSASVPRAGSSA